MIYLIMYLIGYITFVTQELYNEICEITVLSKTEIIGIFLISLMWPLLVVLTIIQLIKELKKWQH